MCSTVQEQITTCGQNAIVKIGERTNIRPQKVQTFYQYTTGIVLLRVAASVSLYCEFVIHTIWHCIACIAIRFVSDDSHIVPALTIRQILSVFLKNIIRITKL